MVRADIQNRLVETSKTNNSRVSAQIAYTFAPPDIVPQTLTAPTTLTLNQSRPTIDVYWAVKNQSTRLAPNGWNDELYFSTDTILDAQDTHLGTFWRSGTLEGGASYQQSQRVRLPDFPSGTYYLFVKVDASNRLVESNDANNTRYQQIQIAVASVNPGTSKQVTLSSYNRYYYEVNAEAGKNLLVTFADRSSTAGLQADQPVKLFMSKDKLPSEDNHEHSAQSQGTQLFAEVPIAATQAGKYYVLVVIPHLVGSPISTSIESSYVDFHVTGVSPNKGSNAGSLTSQLTGIGLGSENTVTLIGPSGQRIDGGEFRPIS
ncbi:MAG: hypothetical protein CYG59_14650, partial [Chloroflexi bacterium]